MSNKSYCILCKDVTSPEPFCIGGSEKIVNVRVREHKNDFKNRFKSGNKNALIRNFLEFRNHEPDLDFIKILDTNLK